MENQLSLMPMNVNQGPKMDIKALSASLAATKGVEAKNAKAMQSAKDFEASFLTIMLEQMWTGVEAEAPFGGGHAEKVYRSMMVNEYAQSLSASGGIGIANHVYEELLRAQEGRK